MYELTCCDFEKRMHRLVPAYQGGPQFSAEVLCKCNTTCFSALELVIQQDKPPRKVLTKWKSLAPQKFSEGLRPLPPAPFNSSRLPFGRLAASILAPWGTILAAWEHLGAPWEQQDCLEVVQHRILIDFGVFLGPLLRFVSAPRLGFSICVRACFQVTFCTDCCFEI